MKVPIFLLVLGAAHVNLRPRLVRGILTGGAVFGSSITQSAAVNGRVILSTMNKAHWAKLCGFASLGCSSFFWAALLFRLIVTVPRFDFSFYFFLGQWALAVVLALVAATLGSNRWAYAALLPILNWLGSFYLVGG